MVTALFEVTAPFGRTVRILFSSDTHRSQMLQPEALEGRHQFRAESSFIQASVSAGVNNAEPNLNRIIRARTLPCRVLRYVRDSEIRLIRGETSCRGTGRNHTKSLPHSVGKKECS